MYIAYGYAGTGGGWGRWDRTPPKLGGSSPSSQSNLTGVQQIKPASNVVSRYRFGSNVNVPGQPRKMSHRRWGFFLVVGQDLKLGPAMA